MRIPQGPRYSRTKALLIVLFSSALVLGVSGAALFFFGKEGAPVTRLLVRGSGLPVAFFAERLGLSSDDPGGIDLAEGKRLLEEIPFIERVSLRSKRGGVLAIDYIMRSPIAFVHNLTSTAIDRHGVLFPYEGFYTPKKLPSVRLPDVRNTHISLFRDVISNCADLHPLLVDLSECEAESLGRREVVLELEGGIFLRLSTRKFPEELAHFRRLREEGLIEAGKGYIVDLRIPKLAFIKEVP